MIAEATDVERKIGRTFSNDETLAAEAAIVEYQADMESWLRRSIERGEKTEELEVRSGSIEVFVAFGPIVSVSELKLDDVVQDASTYEFNRNAISLRGSRFLSSNEYVVVEVTYEGGYDAAKARPARNAVIARTARYMNKRRDDAIGAETVSTEGYSVKYEGDEFTEAEMKACSRLKRRVTSGPVTATSI